MSFVETFRASSPRRQIVGLVAVALVIFATMAAAYFFLLRKPYDPLFSRLRTMDAATIVAELDKKKIPYRLSDGGATILVPRDRVDSTRLAVMSGDLPLKGAVGFELFNKSDMGLTEFAQRINYQRALQGELARTIMTMETVDSARVHLSLAEPSLFRDDRRPAKASVTLTPRDGAKITPDSVRGIQRLVAAAVPDLSALDVVVLNETGQIISADTAAPEATGGDERAAVEGYFAARVRKLLAAISPDDEISVSVTALLPAGAEADEALEGWSATSRSFGLEVAIQPSTPVTPEVRAALEQAVDRAVSFDPSLGDRIILGASAGVPGPVAAVPLSAGVASTPTQGVPAPKGLMQPSQTMFGALLGLLGLLLIGAAVLHWRGRRPSKLSPGQREDYARRLRALLDGEDGHAAPLV